jgi:hypothetical protein
MRVLPQYRVHRHRHALTLGAFVALAAVISACASDGDDSSTGPSSLAATSASDTTQRPPRDTTHKPPRDTTHKPPRDTTKKPPRDTVDTMPPVPAKVALSGRVLAVVVVVPSAGMRDTLRFDPIAGAKVRIMRNLLVNGTASQVLAAELTSDGAGRFSVKDLAGGYYVVYVDPPAGSIWEKNFAYLAATQPNVSVDVYLWRRSDG